MNISILHVNIVLEAKAVSRAIPAVRGRYAREALPQTFDIVVFKCGLL